MKAATVTAATKSGRFKTYRIERTSLTERQLVECDIEGDKVVAVKKHEPDLGRIVVAKFLELLMKAE
jgi:hypothetical protein